MLPIAAGPIRVVLRWQFIVTVVLAVAAGLLAGPHGAASAALGGAVSLVAGWAGGVVAGRKRAASAMDVVTGALLAEFAKIGLIVLQLGLVVALYREVAMGVFAGTFIVTMLIYSMAFFVPDNKKQSSDGGG